MTGIRTIIRKLYGKVHKLSRELEYENHLCKYINNHIDMINDHNKEIIKPLLQLTQPIKHIGWFDWTILYENRGIDSKRREEILNCFNIDKLDTLDKQLVPFLSNMLINLVSY